MFGAAVIVFRETLEAALFVGIMAAATRGLAGRSRWVAAGVLAGVLGAMGLAAGAEQLADWADGIGQDLVNSAILLLAWAMLTWHCVWVSNHGAQAAADARALGQSVRQGERTMWGLMMLVALSVLREGAEAVLFVAGYASGNGMPATLTGAALGVVAGAVVGVIVYFGLSRVPMRHMFKVTNGLIMLLVAAIASQLARTLAQAGLIERWSQAVWDTSGWLPMNSSLGTLAHALIGYEAQPTGLQVAFYVAALASALLGSRWVRRALRESRNVQPIASTARA